MYLFYKKNSEKGSKLKYLIILITFLIILSLPFLIKNNYIKSVIVKVIIYSILSSSLNVINGYSGQFSLGHMGFIAVGAYTAAILATRLGFSFWINIILAGIVAGLIGYLLSKPTLGLSGIYLALVTLGFSEIIRLIALNWTSLTGGALGIKNIPSPILFGIPLKDINSFYYICIIIVGTSLFFIYRIINSKIGRAWISIREDQSAASSLGIDLSKYKSLNFVVGAFFAGIGGCLLVYFYRFVSSDMFELDEGFNIISMVVIGGQGTLVGPILGAIIVNILTEVFRVAMEYRMVVYSILVISMMWFRPQGLAGARKGRLAASSAVQDDEPIETIKKD